MSSGWVKLHREITDHWIWDCEFSYAQAWVDLLLKACHKPNKLMIKGQVIELKRGQQARSEVTLSKEWKWSRGKVRRFINQCLKDGMIECEATHLTSIITICNYDSFQGVDTADGTSGGTTGDTSSGHLTEHKQEVKNLRSKETDSTSPDGDQKQQSKRALYVEMATRFMELLPNMPPVDLKANATQRVTKAANFYKKNGFNPQRWDAYLHAISECEWMMRDRVDSDGKVWKRKGFDFIITEKCYLGVKEDRYGGANANQNA